MKKAILLLAAAALVLLSGCQINNKLLFVYPDGDRYSYGNTAFEEDIAEKIRVLDVAWTSGSVTIAFHDEGTILIEEVSKRDLLISEQVHWLVDGGTLFIKDCKSGAFADHEAISFTKKNKDLTVTLPEALRLDGLTVVTTSGYVETGLIHADTISVSTSSGDSRVICTGDTSSVTMFSTSGRIQLSQSGRLDALTVNTTSGGFNGTLGTLLRGSVTSASGAVSLTAEEADTLETVSTTGKIGVTVTGALGSVTGSSTSGGITVTAARSLSSCRLTATSGKVTLALPEDAGFTADLRSTSGKIDLGFAVQEMYSGTRLYTFGDASAQVYASTTSGDVTIRPIG